MLQSIRDKLTGWVAWTFLAAIAVVFVFWGIDFRAGAETYAAKVDGERIPAEQVRRAWQQRQSQLQQMLRGELPDELLRSQQTMLLDQFIRQTLLTQRALDDGYRVTDAALAQRVMEIPQFQVDGKFSKDRYNALIRSSGMSEGQFERDLMNELLIEQLQRGVMNSAFVTPAELDRRYALEKQAREVAYALIPASEFAAAVNVTEDQIKQYYEQNTTLFTLPEKADVQYVELTRQRAESAVTVTEQELRDYYEQNKERFEAPERRHARHILITTGDGVDEAAAEKKAADLAQQAKAGADFAKLAKENSQDPGSAEQGGDLGWAQRGMFVGPFEEALFSMAANEIRGPIKTQFGYHVIRLEGVEAGRMQSFEEASAELEDEYRASRAQTIFYDESQKLADLAFSTLTELDSVAQAMDLPVKTVDGFTRELGGGDLDRDPGVIDAVFSEEVLQRGENSSLLTIGEDRALVLRVSNHEPPRPRPLEEVRAQIESQLRTQAMRDAAASKGAEAVARLQKGESWQDVAASMKLNPVGKRFITRDDSIAPAAVARAAFSGSRGQITEATPFYTGAVTDDGNYAVVAVSDVRTGDPSAESAQQKSARQRAVENEVAADEFAGYITELERNADIVRNENVFE